ncbi:hypothetical protein K470DRAFT_274793 [Piedraia hortae CBS 480.64]|uniref:Uncharacterized protein n=1 Tax=Piedraia hortae CBS 480.64 TaxID=1314780 RepID=A0A6A7C7F8_9PEZI|nr:hypothetical protein K470DRAFT_274793 [Piedraia hortae CBS 480.64]
MDSYIKHTRGQKLCLSDDKGSQMLGEVKDIDIPHSDQMHAEYPIALGLCLELKQRRVNAQRRCVRVFWSVSKFQVLALQYSQFSPSRNLTAGVKRERTDASLDNSPGRPKSSKTGPGLAGKFKPRPSTQAEPSKPRPRSTTGNLRLRNPNYDETAVEDDTQGSSQSGEQNDSEEGFLDGSQDDSLDDFQKVYIEELETPEPSSSDAQTIDDLRILLNELDHRCTCQYPDVPGQEVYIEELETQEPLSAGTQTTNTEKEEALSPARLQQVESEISFLEALVGATEVLSPKIQSLLDERIAYLEMLLDGIGIFNPVSYMIELEVQREAAIIDLALEGIDITRPVASMSLDEVQREITRLQKRLELEI